MSDKSRSTFPVAVSFAEGELPTHTKMNALSRQAKAGLGILEYVVGDVWNQGGDALLQAGSLTGNALMIPNLARFVGASKYTSPFIPYLANNVDTYIYSFALDTATEYEAQLTFPPAAGSSYTWSGTSTPVAGQLQANASDVNSTGDWWIDTDTGFCRFYDPIQTDWLLFYNAQVDGDLGSDAYFNIMPDPWTETSWTFQSCKIAYANDVDNTEGYLIFLPPRGPLQSARLFSSFFPQSRYDASGNVYNDNPASPDAGSRTFWQSRLADGATAAGYAEHYRYNLPTFITDNWSANSLLPTGSIYLWDSSQTGTVIEGVSLYAENAGTPRVWVLKASGAALDTWVSTYGVSAGYPASLAGTLSDHSSTYYPSGGLKVIISGSPISQTVSYLRKVFWSHDHGSSSSMPTRAVPHNKLRNLFGRSDELLDDVNSAVSGSFFFEPSALSADDHPQYLHRGGSTWPLTNRDTFANGMMGDLLLLSKDSTNNHQNMNDDSFHLRFGQSSFGGDFYYHSARDKMLVTGKPLAASVGFDAYPTSESSYGYSDYNGTEYGEVRRHYISPQEFLVYRALSTADEADIERLEDIQGAGTSVDFIQPYDYYGSWNHHQAEALYLTYGSYDIVAKANIKLPFAKWALVDFAFSIKLSHGSWTSGGHYAYVGYTEHRLTSSGNPQAGSTASLDLFDMFNGTGPTSYPVPRKWHAGGYRGVSANRPFVEVDATTDSAFKTPYLAFLITAGAAYPAMFIRDIVVYYRVKEF